MNDVAIRVEGLGKRYHIGEREPYSALRDSITRAFRAPFRRNGVHQAGASEIWALRDVSFDVKRGEVVGVIGRNGAGKSTLLKILTRVTEPTEGRAEVFGRVGSLLEVGTGFHPELTGRENVYLNGAVLGMQKAEVARKFDEIVAFAEVEQFVDTPVKHYSSGMQMRLAFSVAAHLDPEILLIDEVLAVGDTEFQRKCLSKMNQAATEGRTVLVISHNLPLINTLCDRSLLLDHGRLIMSGPPGKVVERYLQAGLHHDSERVWPDPATAPGSHKARVHAVRVVNDNGDLVTETTLNEAITIELEYWALTPGTVLNTSICVFTQDQVMAFSSSSYTDATWYQKPHPTGLFRSRCRIPSYLLNEGRYAITVLLVERGSYITASLDAVVSVDVVDLGTDRGGYFGHWPGAVRPRLDWTTEVVSQPACARDIESLNGQSSSHLRQPANHAGMRR